MKSLFFLRLFNTISWCMFKSPFSLGLFTLNRVQSYLEKFLGVILLLMITRGEKGCRQT